MLNEVLALRGFCEVSQTSFLSTEILDAANESMRENWKYWQSVRGPIAVRSRRRMTLEGLILNFFAGWGAGVGSWGCLHRKGHGGKMVQFGLWRIHEFYAVTTEHKMNHLRAPPTNTIVDRDVERTSAKFGP